MWFPGCHAEYGHHERECLRQSRFCLWQRLCLWRPLYRAVPPMYLARGTLKWLAGAPVLGKGALWKWYEERRRTAGEDSL